MRLGIDVGGTNTDAVLVSKGTVIVSAKRPTTSDVSSGIVDATRSVLEAVGQEAARISRVTIGTTHFANAFVERQGLLKVGVIRLAGASAGAVPPMSGWPRDLREQIGGSAFPAVRRLRVRRPGEYALRRAGHPQSRARNPRSRPGVRGHLVCVRADLPGHGGAGCGDRA